MDLPNLLDTDWLLTNLSAFNCQLIAADRTLAVPCVLKHELKHNKGTQFCWKLVFVVDAKQFGTIL